MVIDKFLTPFINFVKINLTIKYLFIKSDDRELAL